MNRHRALSWNSSLGGQTEEWFFEDYEAPRIPEVSFEKVLTQATPLFWGPAVDISDGTDEEVVLA